MKTKLFLLTILIVITTSCSDRNYPQTVSAKYPKTNPGKILIYSKDIHQDYEIISLVGTEVDGDLDELIELLKKKAAKLGADAIIHFNLTGPNHFSKCMVASGVAVKLNQNYAELSDNQ